MTDHGGPAFARSAAIGDEPLRCGHEGMTVRTYAAIEAMKVYMDVFALHPHLAGSQPLIDAVAKASYRMADAMVKQMRSA